MKTTSCTTVSTEMYRQARTDVLYYAVEKLFRTLPDADYIEIRLVKFEEQHEQRGNAS